jgi:hypothetical protein
MGFAQDSAQIARQGTAMALRALDAGFHRHDGKDKRMRLQHSLGSVIFARL